jgi:hypothetical protein
MLQFVNGSRLATSAKERLQSKLARYSAAAILSLALVPGFGSEAGAQNMGPAIVADGKGNQIGPYVYSDLNGNSVLHKISGIWYILPWEFAGSQAPYSYLHTTTDCSGTPYVPSRSVPPSEPVTLNDGITHVTAGVLYYSDASSKPQTLKICSQANFNVKDQIDPQCETIPDLNGGFICLDEPVVTPTAFPLSTLGFVGPWDVLVKGVK